MKATLCLLLTLFSTSALALEAMILVLEAPYFSKPDYSSKIVQYARKGDIVKVHPSVDNSGKFDYLRPDQKKLSRVRKQLRKTPEWTEDEVFPGDIDDTFSVQDDWIAVLDRQGKRRYMRKEHLYVYFNDSREFIQDPYPKDETDYRLEEPLPRKYPLRSVSGYRGLFLIGTTQPYTESYPYLNPTKAKGYNSPLDFSVTLLREAGEKKQDRFYFGGTANLRHYRNTFSFIGGGKAAEENYRFGVGPYICYDAFKGNKDRLNIFTSINVYLLNFTSISQTSPAGTADNRTYQAYSVAPRLGLQYHRKGIFPDLDFVAGTALEMEPPTTYHARNGAKVDGIWRNNGTDRYSTRFVWNIAAFIGLQSAY